MINERPMPGWLASPAAGRLLLIGIVAVSVLSLGVAFVGEHAFGIQPCILCLYQRIPYIVTALVAGAAAVLPISPGSRRGTLGLCGIVFAAGAALAFYSVGVEEHWWAGIAGCEGTAPPILSIEDLQAELAQPSGLRACDEDVWRLFGLSLAAYNAMAQVVVAAGCLVGLWGSRDAVGTPRK
jgi:disulfide bond formation protein DsbB